MNPLPSLAACAAATLAVGPAIGGEPVISEFMASNSATLADADNHYPDWIELHNPDAGPADLTGWGLRDSSETWLFPPAVSIPAGGYLLVFASGATGKDAAGNLHASLKLDAAGEPLALLRPDGSVAFEYTDVPSQREDVAYGLISEQELLVTPESPSRYRVPANDLANNWQQSDYDDTSWTNGVAAVGFKTTPGPVLGGGGGFYTAYIIEAGTPGTQSYGGSLGMDFEVLEEVRVTDLGVFDSNSDGLARTITAQLWRRDGNSGVAVLASDTFTPGDPGTLDGGSRFKALAAPLVLAPGSYTMVAYGYGAGEQNGNQGTGSLDGLDIDTGDGLLQFVGNARYGNAGGFPASIDGGPSNRYAAGTFKFSPNSAGDIGTDIEAAMHGNNASVAVRIPFDAADPGNVGTLLLQMGVDDGFVAWINGIEIARHNAPANLAYDSASTAAANGTWNFPAALPDGALLATGNVLAIHGLNLSAADGDFLVSPTLSGVKNDVVSARYFTTPTPGAPNDPDGIVGFVADTSFSVDRGFFDAPFQLEITTATEGATIRYTTDGSEPVADHGTVYVDPITIGSTTTLRAAAFKDGFEPTNIDTQSYLFLDQVALQDNSQPGYPSSWAGISADYAMDTSPTDYARAAGDANFNPAEAHAAIVASLRAIPTISIVTERDNLFDPSTGIYLNPSGRGSQWERPVSVEIIGEDGIGRYQTNAGLRIMGFTSRNLNTTPKLNMRLLFKKEYGDGQLNYPLLGEEGPGQFNTVALRGNIRDAWVTEYSGFGSALYIGDEWAKRAQHDMGQPAVRGTFAHVYLNGMYWGLYNPTERPDDAFAETYLGGDRDDYDVVKFCCPDRHIAGDSNRWNELRAASNAGLTTTADYERVQGNNPDGSRNPAFPVLIDVDNHIDYLINGHYHAQVDWPGNYYVIRDRVEERSEGFKFFTWDNDIPFGGGNPNAGNKVQTAPGNNWWTESPGEMDIALRRNADYRIRFADRVYKHYFHGGAMTVDSNIARWQRLATSVRPALFAESARWGDARGSALRTVQNHWDTRAANMVNNYFPNRQAVVFNQMRTHDLYPDLDAPEYNQRGGQVAAGFGLRFSADATVYYTTDGSDPRLPGGAVNPSASSASAGVDTVTLVASGAGARAIVPADASLGSAWRELQFDDSTWTPGISGVGYENGSGYEDEIGLDLKAAMRGINGSAYLRIPFAGVDADDFQSLTLRMKYDDGFVAYLNGVEIARRNAPAELLWNSTASGFPTDQQALIFEDIDVSDHRGLLSADGNLLAVHGLNFGAGSSDFLIVPELQGESLSAGDSVPVNATSHIRARAFDGGEWSALNEATFIVGTAPTAASLAVSELMYHPALGDGAGEYIEVMNISASDTLDLTGVHFSEGIDFTFPLGFALAPGARAVIVGDPDAFAAAQPAVSISGTFSGALDNGGERITLAGAGGAELISFRYNDKAPWPKSPDGDGPSLVLVSPQSAPDHSLASNWRPSTEPGGNPGATDAIPYAGGDLLDYALAGPPHLLIGDDGLPRIQLDWNLGSDDAAVAFEVSENLQSWFPAGAELVTQEDPGDGTQRQIYSFTAGPAGERWFVRGVISQR